MGGMISIYEIIFFAADLIIYYGCQGMVVRTTATFPRKVILISAFKIFIFYYFAAFFVNHIDFGRLSFY